MINEVRFIKTNVVNRESLIHVPKSEWRRGGITSPTRRRGSEREVVLFELTQRLKEKVF